jgi:GntR family transcriptional repressor for pyruvate dehydrogenase complex
MIQEGELSVGDKLPDHTQFARQLKVSRTTLREALHTLSLLGVVEQRAGYGTVLTGPVPPQYEESFRLPPLEGPEAVGELLEARRVTELGTVELAARKATGENLEWIGAILGEMQRSFQEERMEAFVREDLEFHYEIARASQNRFLVRIFESMWSFTEQFMEEGFRVAPGMVKRSLEQHQRIYEALEKRDPKRARSEMSKHIAKRRKVLGPLLKRTEGSGAGNDPPGG